MAAGPYVFTSGFGPQDVVEVTAHLQHLRRDFAAYDAAYRALFKAVRATGLRPPWERGAEACATRVRGSRGADARGAYGSQALRCMSRRAGLPCSWALGSFSPAFARTPCSMRLPMVPSMFDQ